MNDKLESLTSKNIHVDLPERGGSLIILQRNAPTRGKKISSNAAKQTRMLAKEIITKFLESLNDSDRSSIDMLVVGSDPRIGVDNEAHPESLAALETAEEVRLGIQETMRLCGLKDAQFLNTTAVPGGGIVEISEIKGWLPIKDSPELFEFFKNKAVQTGEDIATLYETDAYKEERENLGVEGAKDITTRMEHFLSFSRGSTNYHAAHPNRRLIFWAVTRFDTITPYLRTILAHPAECSEIIPVEHLGGITLKIKADHTATVTIREREYATNLYYSPVTG